MKPIIFLLLLSSILYSSCQSDSPDGSTATYDPRQDSTRRDIASDNHYLSVQKAFIKLPARALILEPFERMTTAERRRLLKEEGAPIYQLQQVGNYLSLKERDSHPDEPDESLAYLRMAVYHSVEYPTIVFVSEEWRQEGNASPQIVQQRFWQYQQGDWVDITNQLPPVRTQDFFESDAQAVSGEHWYWELNPQDVNYIAARLQYQYYTDKALVIQQEAYRVALVWDGNQFVHYRHLMVHYEISEHHDNPSAKR